MAYPRSTWCGVVALGVLLFPSGVRAQCPPDLNGDGVVAAGDLAQLLGAWGPNAGHVADLDGSGIVDGADLAQLLGAWGKCVALPIRVQLPGGEFEMGCHVHPVGCPPSELPVHAVVVGSFFMGVYEVTNQQFAEYLNSAYAQGLIETSGGVVYQAGEGEPYCDTFAADMDSRIIWDGRTFTVTGQDLPADDLGNKTQHPMVAASWHGAAAYCNWLSVQDGRQPCYDLDSWTCDFGQNGYRLPTEAEWEYAARGGLHDPYYQFPWGDDLDGSKGNYFLSGDPWEGLGDPHTSVVGYYDGRQIPSGVDLANGYGLYDMSGNVWEWCNDWYSGTYYQSSAYDNPQGPANGDYRVVRGGSWLSGVGGFPYTLRCAARGVNQPVNRSSTAGFRVVTGT